MADEHTQQPAPAPDGTSRISPLHRNIVSGPGKLRLDAMYATVAEQGAELLSSLAWALAHAVSIYLFTSLAISLWSLLIPLRSLQFSGLFKDEADFKWATWLFCCNWMFYRVAVIPVILIDTAMSQVMRILREQDFEPCLYSRLHRLARTLERKGISFLEGDATGDISFQAHYEVFVALAHHLVFWTIVVCFKIGDCIHLLQHPNPVGAWAFGMELSKDNQLANIDKLLLLLPTWLMMFFCSAVGIQIIEYVEDVMERMQQRPHQE